MARKNEKRNKVKDDHEWISIPLPEDKNDKEITPEEIKEMFSV